MAHGIGRSSHSRLSGELVAVNVFGDHLLVRARGIKIDQLPALSFWVTIPQLMTFRTVCLDLREASAHVGSYG